MTYANTHAKRVAEKFRGMFCILRVSVRPEAVVVFGVLDSLSVVHVESRSTPLFHLTSRGGVEQLVSAFSSFAFLRAANS